MHVAFETQGVQRVTTTQAELGTKVDPVCWPGSCYQHDELSFSFSLFYRDISHNKISTLEDGIFDNLFNLSEM